MTTLRESQSHPTKRCCETGRPIAVDPATGSTICSCQMQTGVPAYLSRVPRLPESFYGTIAGNHSSSEAVSAFYQSYPGTDRLVDSRSMAQASGLVHSTAPYLGHAMAAHPYGAFYPDYDLMAARRKNATRETTGPLKSWLYQHRKNPYPTKAEKVMLAIITQMTLTQVSTWFANARRRLKKENKLGKDVDISDIDVEDKIEGETASLNISLDSSVSDTSSTGNRDRLSSAISDISDAEDRSSPNTSIPKKCVQRLFSPDGRDELYLERMYSPENEKAINKDNVCDSKTVESSLNTVKGLASCVTKDSIPTKPKIWSVADMLR